MQQSETIQLLQQIIAQQATELQQLKAELKQYRPVMVVSTNGTIAQCKNVTETERMNRIVCVNEIAKLQSKGMFRSLAGSQKLKTDRYIETCELHNKIDAHITTHHFK